MEAEDMTSLRYCGSSSPSDEKNENDNPNNGLREVDSGNHNPENREGSLDLEEDMDITEDDFKSVDGKSAGNSEQVSGVNYTSAKVSIRVVDTVTVANKKAGNFSSEFQENGCSDAQDGGLGCVRTSDTRSKSGVKRARTTFDEQQPLVHVIYNSLTRASKEKLEQLLREWSVWQAEHGSSAQSAHDPGQILESGEETYFPALRVGLEKTSSVTYWIDQQSSDNYNKGVTSVDSSTAPLYDRGYSLGLTTSDGFNNLERGLEIVDDPSRCFNCGSYAHSLKDCPKPRDNAAVSAAREQYRAKRNQNPGSRLPSRYYQTSLGGRFDDLKPGSLHVETRELLGLKDLDPPPWLNRMRELGYPPGYLVPDDEDGPSGITIYGNEGVMEEEREDGELDERADPPEPRIKMAVEFPGINAPIPENADKSLWASLPSGSDQSRGQHPRRSSHYRERSTRENHYEQRSGCDLRDDGPPGIDLMLSPSSYPPRSRRHDFGYDFYNPIEDSVRRRSPAFDRSYSSSRGWKSPGAYDDHYHRYRYTPSRDHDFDDWVRDDHDINHSRSRRR